MFKVNGKVVKIIDNKTVKVEITRKYPHEKYIKVIKSVKNFLVHNDKDITYKEGDIVTIVGCAPVSKKKRYKIL